MKTLSSKILDIVTQRLVSEFSPDKIILFGSHVWGNPGDDSDIDLLVIVPESELRPVQRSIRAHRCLRGLNIPKDILVKTRSEVERFRHVYASLEAQVLEQGKVLYERSQK